jgi:hypothetical protein
MILLAFAAALAWSIPVAAGEFDKTGQSGMTFLKIGPVARAAGMGDAYTGLSTGVGSCFYNPAGLGFLPGKLEIMAGQVNWMADIKIASAAIGMPIRIGGTTVAVAGISYVGMDYGTIYGTVINKTSANGAYSDIGNLEPSEFLLGLTLAKQFTDKFSLGLTGKYVNQGLPWYRSGGNTTLGLTPTLSDSLDEFAVRDFVFDAGTLYKTGFGSTTISMSIRNFSRKEQHVYDGFAAPMTFHIGVAGNLLDPLPMLGNAGHKLLVALDGIHPPDHPEKVALGGEYSFNDMVFLRGGYAFNNDARTWNTGAGFRFGYAGFNGMVDYAYSDAGSTLGAINYVTLSFGMQ